MAGFPLGFLLGVLGCFGFHLGGSVRFRLRQLFGQRSTAFYFGCSVIKLLLFPLIYYAFYGIYDVRML